MKVECPECHARFKVDPGEVQPGGRKGRCSKCQAVFTIYPDLTPENENDFEGTPAAELEGEAAKQENMPVSNIVEEGDSYEASVIDRSFINEHKEESEKKKSKSFLFFIFFLLLVAGAATCWYSYPLLQNFLNKPSAKQEKPVENQAASVPKVVPDKEVVEKIVLEDVRQYFVENEKIGRLFVVEGKVVNRFDTPKELIRLRASLYEDGGKFFSFKDFYAGNVLSLFQLQILSQEELEAGLEAKVGVLTNNINVQPGNKVPFLTVFFNPPANVTEFGLEVIDAKDLK